MESEIKVVLTLSFESLFFDNLPLKNALKHSPFVESRIWMIAVHPLDVIGHNTPIFLHSFGRNL